MDSVKWNARDAIKALILAHVGPLAIIGACTLCGTAVLIALHQRDQANVARGIAVERARVADSTILAWVPLLHKADTLVVHDTVKVTRTIARVDSLRDTLLLHLTDTVRVKEYVARTDSALHACSELTHDCAAFRQSANATIRALNDKLALQAKLAPRPSLLHDATRFLVGVGIGYLIPKHR